MVMPYVDFAQMLSQKEVGVMVFGCMFQEKPIIIRTYTSGCCLVLP